MPAKPDGTDEGTPHPRTDAPPAEVPPAPRRRWRVRSGVRGGTRPLTGFYRA